MIQWLIVLLGIVPAAGSVLERFVPYPPRWNFYTVVALAALLTGAVAYRSWQRERSAPRKIWQIILAASVWVMFLPWFVAWISAPPTYPMGNALAMFGGFYLFVMSYAFLQN